MRLPCDGINRLTSGFRLPDRTAHDGIDIVGKATPATVADRIPVKAIADMAIEVSTIVAKSGSDLTWQWGNYVRGRILSGPFTGYKPYMCHLDSRNVKAGQTVKEGDVIGIMGETGYSQGVHLHLGIKNPAGSWVDPAAVIGIKNAKGTYYQGESQPSGGTAATSERDVAKVKIKVLEVFGDKNCQAFDKMDVSVAAIHKVSHGQYIVTAENGQAGGFEWCRVWIGEKEYFVPVIADRCEILTKDAGDALQRFFNSAKDFGANSVKV